MIMDDFDKIRKDIDMYMEGIKSHSNRQWNRFLSLALVVFVALLAIGAVQLRVSTKNSVTIERLIDDERMAVDYRTWYRYNMTTNLEIRALSSFLNGDEKRFVEVMNEFDDFKFEITKEYRAKQEDRYRGVVKRNNDN